MASKKVANTNLTNALSEHESAKSVEPAPRKEAGETYPHRTVLLRG
jgi:hypothetical protein